MKNVKYLMAVSCLSAVALAGCGTGPFGVHPLIENDEFEEIDLANLLSAGKFSMDKSTSEFKMREELELAFADFTKQIDKIPVEAHRKRARNRIQERILAASNQACGEYKHDLKQLDARFNFILGSLTTGLAGAGAIFTGVDIVRALSGAAGITSGVRAEFNNDYFQNKTIQVITDGLESKRQEIYEKILEDREQDLEKYPVQRAIKDAIKYHENCSLISGLEQAAISIERADNPGADAMNKFLEKMGDTRSALDVMTGKPQIGAAAATKDMSQLYDALDESQQTRSTVASDKDKRLQIPADLKADTVAQTALKNWKPVVDTAVAAAFSTFDKAYAKILKATVEIAKKVHGLTAVINNKKTTKDQRSVKMAELAVEQAKIRSKVNELNSAEQTLASNVDKALKGFENAMAKVKEKIEAEAALKKAQAGGNADAITKAQAEFDAKTKAAVAAAKAN